MKPEEFFYLILLISQTNPLQLVKPELIDNIVNLSFIRAGKFYIFVSITYVACNKIIFVCMNTNISKTMRNRQISEPWQIVFYSQSYFVRGKLYLFGESE